MISFSIESSPDTVYLEDLISFQADLKDLDEFPEELSEISSACSNKSPEQEQEHFDCSPSPSSSVSSPPTSPFSHIKNSYTIPKSSISPERFNTFHHRRSLCTKHHSVLCTECCVPGSNTEVLHQSPGVEALSPSGQAQTHSPPTLALALRTDGRSPTVQSTPLLMTDKLPTAERQSPILHSPPTVTKEAIHVNNCSHTLLPKCSSCGNCICCTLLDIKQSTDSVICSPVEGDQFSKQLTIEIPSIAPLNPTLKSPLSNTALNTPVCEFSPVSPVAPVPQALFVSGTIPAIGPPSPTSDTSVIPCLLSLKVSPTKDFLKKHPPHNGRLSCRWRWPMRQRTRKR